MKSIRIGFLAVAACLVLGACGESGNAPSVNPSGGPSLSSVKPSDPNAEPPVPPANSTAPASPTRSAPRGPGPSKSPGAPASAGALTLTGVIVAGVEPNCLLLDGYLLLSGPRDQLRGGARVTVTGRVQPGMMTTCQQGTPFVVESVKPA
ncbi:hypothetical protein OG792_29435 [Micromonospora sp. NBC_01699]|uniref:hypothetical protein n=1 Tax=Micromonospora sp. NBC_01699 TaxID=2975984 RepID=UPI002E28507C|nr:hypothetical protein [Micromonospora sp. NBC_01699]